MHWIMHPAMSGASQNRGRHALTGGLQKLCPYGEALRTSRQRRGLRLSFCRFYFAEWSDSTVCTETYHRIKKRQKRQAHSKSFAITGRSLLSCKFVKWTDH